MSTTTLAPPEEQARHLQEALQNVAHQASLMKRCLDDNRLLDSLKNCSAMLSELKTSLLSPKTYYELYMAIFDELRYLTTYLRDAHVAGKHHLSDLYELVQYATSIIPRLYLMITVGSVFMSVEGAPVKELMIDMLEMSRGVQHPTRGLFLRHYLSGMTRDYLPDKNTEAKESQGSVADSIEFVIQNFIEMNKLWVRLQYQGHSRDRLQREKERSELRTLVGTNLVRLSQLEGYNIEVYREKILPAVLEQVVSCRDVIAQEYLMEAIIQVFQDDFHLQTLKELLTAISSLEPAVNVKQIVISLIDRLASYAVREAEELDSQPISDSDKEKRGIPDDLKLFDVFWEEIKNLIEKRKDLTIEDISALLVSIENLSLSCYPHSIENVNNVLEYAIKKFEEFRDSPDLPSPVSTQNFLKLLIAPSTCFVPIKILLSNDLASYHKLLSLQPYSTRRMVAISIAKALIKEDALIQELDEIQVLLDKGGLFDALIRDSNDAPWGTSGISSMFDSSNEDKLLEKASKLGVVDGKSGLENTPAIDRDDIIEELGWVARVVHLLRQENPDMQYLLLATARKSFSESGPFRMVYLMPPLVVESIKLVRRYSPFRLEEGFDWEKKTTHLFKFIYQLISLLYNRGLPSPHDISLRLFLMAGQLADEIGFQSIAYEFYVQVFTIYEESISTSESQFQALLLIFGALNSSKIFGSDDHDTLATKATLHANKLLKKTDQCRAVYLSSHLWWMMKVEQIENSEKEIDPNLDRTKCVHRDYKKVLELLQKSLKIADVVLDQITGVELFVEILNQYLCYSYNYSETMVTSSIITSLINLIQTNISNIGEGSPHDQFTSLATLLGTGLGIGLGKLVTRTPPPLTLRHKQDVNAAELMLAVIDHFERTLKFIQLRILEEEASSASGMLEGDSHFWRNIIGVDTGLQGISILIEHFKNIHNSNQEPIMYQSSSLQHSISGGKETFREPLSKNVVEKPESNPLSLNDKFHEEPLGTDFSNIGKPFSDNSKSAEEFIDVVGDEGHAAEATKQNQLSTSDQSEKNYFVPSPSQPIASALEMDPAFSGFAGSF